LIESCSREPFARQIVENIFGCADKCAACAFVRNFAYARAIKFKSSWTRRKVGDAKSPYSIGVSAVRAKFTCDAPREFIYRRLYALTCRKCFRDVSPGDRECASLRRVTVFFILLV
jgi:hypothetical protein